MVHGAGCWHACLMAIRSWSGLWTLDWSLDKERNKDRHGQHGQESDGKRVRTSAVPESDCAVVYGGARVGPS